ncbi:MAG TPA: glycosyltransferase 87 family protein, partial [Solirubrobacteraceae bacterium]|nr:glycosyltransferase 87 family protein [Solirubrobacteraceae bacterium]
MSDSSVTVGGGSVALNQTASRRKPQGDAPSQLISAKRRVWAAYGGLILCGLVVVACTARTPQLSPDNLHLAFSSTVPRIWAGPLVGIGPDIHLGGVIALFTIMCVCYATLVRFGSELSAGVIVAGVVVLHVIMAIAPPLMTTDVFSYLMYGRMDAIYQINPYTHGPYAVRLDSYFPFVAAQWATTPTAYGPLFTGLSALMGHFDIKAATLAYKLLTVVCSLLAIAGTAKAAQRLGRDVGQTVLLVGLNPVLIVYAVGGSHNDMLMMAALCWSVAALVAHRARTAGGLLVTAVAVKLTAGILLPFALAARRGPAGRTRLGGHQWRMLGGGVLVLIAVVVLATVLFGSGPLHLLSTLEVIQADGKRQSIPGFICWGLGFGFLTHGIVIGLQAIDVITIVWLIVAVRRHQIDWITATGWAIVALLATSTFLLPWYVVWLLPFAALSDSRALRLTTIALTAIGMTSL